MDLLMYFPGYGSNSQTDKAERFRQFARDHGMKFYGHEYDGDYSSLHNKSRICENVLGVDRIFCFGTSLGGYWATWTCEAFLGDYVIINPSCEPRNTLGLDLPDIVVPSPGRAGVVILSQDDEVLDHTIALDKFQYGAEVIVQPSGGHRGREHIDLALDHLNTLVQYNPE